MIPWIIRYNHDIVRARRTDNFKQDAATINRVSACLDRSNTKRNWVTPYRWMRSLHNSGELTIDPRGPRLLTTPGGHASRSNQLT
jgi:hypothetical protein